MKPQEMVLLVLNRLEEKLKDFGQPIVQKTFYFLKAVGVDLSFDFSFCHYGPYSFGLQRILEKLDLYGLMSIEYNLETGRYCYNLTSYGRKIVDSVIVDDALEAHLDHVLNLIATRSIKELELISTIHFVQKEHLPPNDTDLVDIVRYLKCNSSVKVVQAGLLFLRSEGILPWTQ